MVVNRFCIAALLLIYLGSVWCFSRFTLPKVGKKVSLFRATNANFENAQEYLEHLETQARLPQGFEVGATTFTFQPFEVANKDLLMNLTIIKTDVPTDSFAAMFTSNKFPGGPVLVGKERMKSSPYIQAVVINNKISNVCPGGLGDGGAGDSDAVCEAVSGALQLPSKDYVFPSSTGIIGWRLPVDAIKANIASVVKSFQSQSFLPGAKGITTTDRYPKLRSYTSSSGSWTISCIAKGAGMIEPDMATMLAYIITDLSLPRQFLEGALQSATSKSFNTISVDGDQSTSDTVFMLSSKKVEATPADKEEFVNALNSICKELSIDIVRNGEGTQHVVRVTVDGAPSSIFARDLGRFVVNSNLVKCAISGCDPNVGRIVGAIGSFLGKQENGESMAEGLVVTMGGVTIFEEGAFKLDPEKEMMLSDYLFNAQLFPSEVPEHDRTYPPHSKTVDIDILMKSGSESAEVIGSDLTKEYVEVNADYRS